MILHINLEGEEIVSDVIKGLIPEVKVKFKIIGRIGKNTVP